MRLQLQHTDNFFPETRDNANFINLILSGLTISNGNYKYGANVLWNTALAKQFSISAFFLIFSDWLEEWAKYLNLIERLRFF